MKINDADKKFLLYANKNLILGYSYLELYQ